MFQVYFSSNQSYEDRHYNESSYEVSSPPIPAQRHKQLPEIPTKKSPYMDYYSSSFYSEQMMPCSSMATKKILPQIPRSRIKLSPSLPQTNYQKVPQRATAEQRSTSLDHKDNEDYEYADHPASSKGPYDEYDDGYYNDDMNLLQQDQQPYAKHKTNNSASAKTEYEIQREIAHEEKKDENEGITRRNTFMKFYQRTVKHLENPGSFFQQHTDSAESQDEHKEVIYASCLVVT